MTERPASTETTSLNKESEAELAQKEVPVSSYCCAINFGMSTSWWSAREKTCAADYSCMRTTFTYASDYLTLTVVISYDKQGNGSWLLKMGLKNWRRKLSLVLHLGFLLLLGWMVLPSSQHSFGIVYFLCAMIIILLLTCRWAQQLLWLLICRFKSV